MKSLHRKFFLLFALFSGVGTSVWSQTPQTFYFLTNAFYGYENGTVSGTIYRTAGSASWANDFWIAIDQGYHGSTPIKMPDDLTATQYLGTTNYYTVFHMNSGQTSATFSIPVKINTSAQYDRAGKLLVNGWPSLPFDWRVTDGSLIQEAWIYVQDKDSAVTPSILRSSIQEGETNYVNFSRGASNWYGPATINFTLGGTASGSDYQISSTNTLVTGTTNQLTIPAGYLDASVKIVANHDSLVEGDETLSVTLAANSAQYVLPSSPTVTTHIQDDYATIEVKAIDPYAAETATNTATFVVSRSGNLTQPVTVNLGIGGTAIGGVDYTNLPSSITIAAGVTQSNIVVRPLIDVTSEPAETIVVSVLTNTAYLLGLHTNAVALIAGEGANPRDSLPKAERYLRGSGANWTNYTIVFPMDGLKGKRRLDLETNTEATLYHYNPTNSGSQSQITNRIAFNTPLASFGGQWGNPLYVGKPYSVGWFAGDPYVGYPAVQIQAYYRTNGALAGTLSLALPSYYTADDWPDFVTNGFARSVEGFGLKTVLRSASDLYSVAGGFGTYVCTHAASVDSTNYTYRIWAAGWSDAQPLVLNSLGQSAYDPLYTLEFSARLASRALFLDQPHFAGQPLPPNLWNKTPEEIYNYGALVTSSFTNATSLYTNLNATPDLRQHPLLDQLVSDLNNDPIALANYVLNEIDLTDAIAYRDDGAVTNASINCGGVNRNALGVYLEGQGSPFEQCALLVYLLRQANYPAAYVFAPDGGLKLLESRVSDLLRLKVSGAQDPQGRLYTTNRLIAVNYPWVAVYIDGKWVHIFPWLKDASVTEGVSICDVLPDPYKTTQLWVKDYVMAKTNIMGFAKPDDDTGGTVFKRYLNKVLETNAPGISMDDIGMRYVNRRHLYTRWEDFPRPTWVTNVCIPVTGLGATDGTNVSPRLTISIYDTVVIELFSVNNPQKGIKTGELRMSDLHNRKMFLAHTNLSGDQYTVSLIMGPYRTNITGTGTFTNDTSWLKRQAAAVTFDSTDDSLILRFRYRRQRPLAWETALDPDRGFLDVSAAQEVLDERPLRKGDLAAICFSVGRVTPAMLRVHAQELWNLEAQVSTNAGSASSTPIDIYQGTLTYLMGMDYYKRTCEFDQLNQRLHKLQNLSQFAVGLAKIGPRRDSNGDLIAGAVDPVWPNVDMFFVQTVSLANGTARPDSGWDAELASRDYLALAAADGSSQEHHILDAYFGRSNAVSTVKLLQLAAAGTNGVVELTWTNYLSKGETFYGTNKLSNYNPALWANVASYFARGKESFYTVAWMTPGPVTAPGGYFSDMAALVLAPGEELAAIGANQRGAFADKFPNNSISTANIAQMETRETGDGDYVQTFIQPTSGQKGTLAEATTDADKPSDYALITNNAVYVNPTQVQEAQETELQHGKNPGSSGSVAAGFQDGNDSGSQGSPNDRQGNGAWATVADPVSTLTGEFYVDDVDLTLSGPMPLQVRRNYGSQNLSANQLGHGWKLSYMPSLVVGLSNNVIYSAEMEGSVLAFGLLSNNVWAPTTALNPTLNNDSRSGLGSVANRFNARLLKTTVGSTNTYYLTNSDGSLRVFVEKSFPLSAAMDRLRPYLTAWYDCLGNYYQFEYGTNSPDADYGQVRRIVSSSGNIVRFEYDPYGRVVDAYSLDGRRVQYEYDQHGDLIHVIRPDTSELEYEYQLATWTTNSVTNVYSTHLLTFEVKPDGRLLKNEYDDQRRVVTQWATVGSDLELVRNATFRYTNNFVLTNLTATLTGTTTVLDWTNNVYTYAYTNGLMRKVADPLGGKITQTWYEENETNAPAYPRSLKTVTDKRGLVTTFLYDSRGNITNTTLRGDLRGDGDTNATAVISAVYTNNNLKVKSVDASGNTTLFFYTNSWLVSRTEFWSSNAAGPQVITNLYVYSMVTNGGKVAFGLKQKEIQAAYSEDAATREWGYDSRGFPTGVTNYTGTADPAVTLTQVFNNRGELVQQTDAAGRTTLMTYDPSGNPESREVYEAGQSIPLAWEYSYYNQNGQVTWYDGPRFNPEDYSYRDYDGAGRKYVEIRWRTRGKQDGGGVEAETGDNLYATSFYEYDPFNNLTKVTDPLGRYRVMKYDALGQLLRTESYDAAGTLLSTNGMAYNLGGDVVTVFNPLGGRTDKQYTWTGKLSFQGDPDGSTNAWRYREDGRLRREIRSNGA